MQFLLFLLILKFIIITFFSNATEELQSLCIILTLTIIVAKLLFNNDRWCATC